jgi:hypothetical protein
VSEAAKATKPTKGSTAAKAAKAAKESSDGKGAHNGRLVMGQDRKVGARTEPVTIEAGGVEACGWVKRLAAVGCEEDKQAKVEDVIHVTVMLMPSADAKPGDGTAVDVAVGVNDGLQLPRVEMMQFGQLQALAEHLNAAEVAGLRPPIPNQFEHVRITFPPPPTLPPSTLSFYGCFRPVTFLISSSLPRATPTVKCCNPAAPAASVRVA